MSNSNGGEAIALLKRIAVAVEVLALAQARSNDRATAAEAVADRVDLDGKYGDPQVKFLPRDWHGDDFKGCNFSTCPPDLLDQLAAAFDYFAKKNDQANATDAKGRPKSYWDRKSAALARGWAARIRGGWKAPNMDAGDADPALTSEWPDDDQVPF